MKPTVLVVEDDLEINELLGEYLALEEIQYLQATTGKSGIDQAAAKHPDAVILDLMLPDIHGFQVAGALSAKRATYDIPVVILSCMCQTADRQNGFAAGALSYMNKPFLPDDLLSAVRRAFAWRDSLKIRPPVGSVPLSEKDPLAFPQALRQMLADIFARTDLSDAAVAQIRQAAETLSQWACRWNTEHHADTRVRLDYNINALQAHEIGWKLSESQAGMLAEAFFKPATGPAGAGGGGLMGWGGNILIHKPVPLKPSPGPPVAWQQILEQTGAVRFERDARAQTVQFTRTESEPKNPELQPAAAPDQSVCHA